MGTGRKACVCAGGAQPLLIPGPAPGPRAGKESRAAEEQGSAGMRRAERRQEPRRSPCRAAQGPWSAGLADTYPPAAGILLQKLSELGQEDVPRSFTLQGKEK